jgi:hypothetical protein
VRKHGLRVFENRVVRRKFGPKGDEVVECWRKMHDVELHNLYSSPNIIRTIKSRRMRWAGREDENIQTFDCKTSRKNGTREDLEGDGRILLKWMCDRYILD